MSTAGYDETAHSARVTEACEYLADPIKLQSSEQPVLGFRDAGLGAIDLLPHHGHVAAPQGRPALCRRTRRGRPRCRPARHSGSSANDHAPRIKPRRIRRCEEMLSLVML